ncbi:hypothetical protein A2U01_0064058, partial [Trifolium medium]|nr:hypothetical protein [Trifolium medium]
LLCEHRRRRTEATTKINDMSGVRSVLNDLNSGGGVDDDGGGEDR